MCKFKKEIHNPIDMIKKFWPDSDVSNITYDPEMKRGDRQYWRIEQCGGDGTFTFSIEMMQKLLIRIVSKNSFYLPTEPKDWSKVKDIKYTIGPVSHATVYGRLKLRCGGYYAGKRERVRMPVKCEYVY